MNFKVVRTLTFEMCYMSITNASDHGYVVHVRSIGVEKCRNVLIQTFTMLQRNRIIFNGISRLYLLKQFCVFAGVFDTELQAALNSFHYIQIQLNKSFVNK